MRGSLTGLPPGTTGAEGAARAAAAPTLAGGPLPEPAGAAAAGVEGSDAVGEGPSIGAVLSGVKRGSPIPAIVTPLIVINVAVEHERVGVARDGRLGPQRVVVAAHEHVGHAGVGDARQHARLDLGPPGGDVARVDDHVGVELLHQARREVEAQRVEVDVADVQHRHDVVGGRAATGRLSLVA